MVRLKPTLITLRYTIFLLTLGIKQWLSNIMQYSGSVVAGLCLLSPAIMKLRHKDDSNIQLDVLLEPGTFYIQRYHLNAPQFMLSHPLTDDLCHQGLNSICIYARNYVGQYDVERR